MSGFHRAIEIGALEALHTNRRDVDRIGEGPRPQARASRIAEAFVRLSSRRSPASAKMLLHISSEAVIPAKAGIQLRNTGFRVKPGMTIKVKGLLTQYTSVVSL